MYSIFCKNECATACFEGLVAKKLVLAFFSGAQAVQTASAAKHLVVNGLFYKRSKTKRMALSTVFCAFTLKRLVILLASKALIESALCPMIADSA